VLSETYPPCGPIIKLGSPTESFFLEFFNEDLWKRIPDAAEYEVSGLLRFENLTPHRVFIENHGQPFQGGNAFALGIREGRQNNISVCERKSGCFARHIERESRFKRRLRKSLCETSTTRSKTTQSTTTQSTTTQSTTTQSTTTRSSTDKAL
jgi:hypothetical protein